MVGSAIVRCLKQQGYRHLITRTHRELDLCRQDAVEAFLQKKRPSMSSWLRRKSAALVPMKRRPADFMWDNMTLEMNVIHAAWANGCKKLEFFRQFLYLPAYGAAADERRLSADVGIREDK